MDPGSSPEELTARLDGACISTYILMMSTVVLRMMCRKAAKAGYWWDDWIAVLAMFFANGLFYVIMIYTRQYVGHHAIDIGLPAVQSFVKAFLAAQLFYVVSVGVIKLSILAFYWRLFSVASRLPIIAVSFVVFVWIMSLISAVIFQCTPVQATWDLSIVDKTCMSTKGVYSGGSIPNIITDLILIIMPLPHIWRLQICTPQRLILFAVFMVGCFVLIVSIIRFKILMGQDIDNADITYEMFEVIVWSVVEVNIGLVCACLPSLRPVFTFLRLGRLFSTPRGTNSTPLPNNEPSKRSRRKSSTALFSSFTGLTSTNGLSQYRGNDEDGFVMIDKDPSQSGLNGNVWGKNKTDIEASRNSNEDSDDTSRRQTQTGPDGITIKTDWSVQVNESRR